MGESLSYDDLFRIFVLQHQQQAMIFLGKLVHPESNEIVRDLDAARLSIDLLGMLEEKTKGNLSKEEEQLLEGVLYELRMKFMAKTNRIKY